MNIGYLGYQGFGNLGDEALYDAHNDLFENIHLSGSRSPIVRKLARWKDHLITPRYYFLGGGTLINQTDMLLEECKHFASRGTKMMCLGSGVVNPLFWDSIPADLEPYGRHLDEWIPILRKFAFLGVRGPLSVKILEDQGLENVKLTGDPVVALARNDIPEEIPQDVVGMNFGLANYNLIWGRSNKDFSRHICGLLGHFGDMKMKVKILPVCATDFQFCKKFLAENRISLSHADIELHDHWADLAAYRNEVRSCRYFMGEKLHSVVIATLERVPSIMFEYQPKCRDFMASINQNDFCLRTDEISLEKVIDLFETMRRDFADIRKSIDDNIRLVKGRLESAARDIENIVLNNSPPS